MLHSFKLKFKLLKLLFLTTICSLILLFVSCWTFHHILLFLFRFLHRTVASSCCCRPDCRNRWLFFLYYYFRNFRFGRRFFFRNDLTTSIVCLRYNIFLSEAEAGIDSSSSFFSKVIIASISTVKIIISFEPLSKLEIVLVFSLG